MDASYFTIKSLTFFKCRVIKILNKFNHFFFNTYLKEKYFPYEPKRKSGNLDQTFNQTLENQKIDFNEAKEKNQELQRQFNTLSGYFKRDKT